MSKKLKVYFYVVDDGEGQRVYGCFYEKEEEISTCEDTELDLELLKGVRIVCVEKTFQGRIIFWGGEE